MTSINTGNRKKVTFGEGTAPPRVVRLAVSISRHETIEHTGVTTYFVDVLQCGKVTVVKRRYKDFEILNKTLILETGHLGYALPQLPQKRWFQTQRWLNRYDPAYIDDRRYGLEVYLRSLLRLNYFIDNCASLRNFLNLTVLVPEDMFALERDAFDAIKQEYTYYYEPEPDDDRYWKPVEMNLSPITKNNGALESERQNLLVDETIVGKCQTSTLGTTTTSAEVLHGGSDSDNDSDDDDDDDERIASQAMAPMSQNLVARDGLAGSLGNSRFASVFIDGNMERKNSFRREDSISSTSPGLGTSPSSSRCHHASAGQTTPSGVDEPGIRDDGEFSPKQNDDEFGADGIDPNDDPNDMWTMSLTPGKDISNRNSGRDSLSRNSSAPPPPLPSPSY